MVSVGEQEMEGKCAHAHARTHACAWPSHAGTWAGLCERLYTASSAGPTTASMRARGDSCASEACVMCGLSRRRRTDARMISAREHKRTHGRNLSPLAGTARSDHKGWRWGVRR